LTRALYPRLPTLTVLLLDVTVGPLLLARAQHWEILAPDSLVLRWPFLNWALAYYILSKLMLMCDVYREARSRRVLVRYRLMNVDESDPSEEVWYL
jgi:hypothetical protein